MGDKKIPNTKYPIILAHGIYRFDKIFPPAFSPDNSKDDSRHYFKNIRSMLMGHGYTVFHSSVDWGGSLATRAKDLRDQIRLFTDNFTTHEKLHIIAHSMGGLDARKMLYEYQMNDKVVSLTTIGAPHHGSPFADWVEKHAGFTIELLDSLGLNITGLHDLTTNSCEQFNKMVSEWEKTCGVKFRAYAGKQNFARIFPPLKLSYQIIFDKEGENDGLSSVKSARWNDEYSVEPPLDADHLNEVGWWEPSEIWSGDISGEIEKRIKKLYLDIANGLTG